MSVVKFRSGAEFQLSAQDDSPLGYAAIVTFGSEEVYRGKRFHQEEQNAIDEAEDYITGAIARLLRLWAPA